MGCHVLLPEPISPSTQAGMSALCQALAANEAISSSLRHMDLSGNPGSLAMEDTSVSMGWEMPPGARKHLGPSVLGLLGWKAWSWVMLTLFLPELAEPPGPVQLAHTPQPGCH